MTDVGETGEGSLTGVVRARPRPAGEVNGIRVAAGTVGVVACAAGVMVMIARLPGGGSAKVAGFALGLALVPVVASPIEWFGHRFVYHEEVLRPLGAIFVVHTARTIMRSFLRGATSQAARPSGLPSADAQTRRSSPVS